MPEVGCILRFLGVTHSFRRYPEIQESDRLCLRRNRLSGSQ